MQELLDCVVFPVENLLAVLGIKVNVVTPEFLIEGPPDFLDCLGIAFFLAFAKPVNESRYHGQ